MKDVTANMTKQSIRAQTEKKALSQTKAIQNYYGAIGIAAVAAVRPVPRRIQERGLRSGCDRMVRSRRLVNEPLPRCSASEIVTSNNRCQALLQAAVATWQQR
jgi:hypothetical protein